MKILISADMEGISGVVSPDHTSAEHKEYKRFCSLMTADVNAAIEGAVAGGGDRIIVNDSHGSMTNVLLEELNPCAELISGNTKPFRMMQGIDSDVNVVFFVGYHAAAGTGAAVLAHTWAGCVFEVHLNDQAVGETGLNAALAGAYGVPVVLVTGDQAVAAEAQALLGRIETATVKESLGSSAAQCLPPEEAHRLIRQAAQRAVKTDAAPFVLEPPVTVRVTFQNPFHADRAELAPGSRRVDGRRVEWVGEDMRDVYQAFIAMMGLAS